MKLTKAIIESVTKVETPNQYYAECYDDPGASGLREFKRLALLGLERDNDRERVRKDFAEELVASMESNIRNGEAVVAMGIDSNDQSLMREGRLRELAAMFVREMVLACRFKDKLEARHVRPRAVV